MDIIKTDKNEMDEGEEIRDSIIIALSFKLQLDKKFLNLAKNFTFFFSKTKKKLTLYFH